jgi:hypothetical protein
MLYVARVTASVLSSAPGKAMLVERLSCLQIDNRNGLACP